jgi:hypothetical protein
MPRSTRSMWTAHPLDRAARLILKAAAGLIVMAVLPTVTSPVSAQTIPNDPQATCTVTAPVFASWFESGSPSLNGVVKPANSVTFPNTPNCSFYQWSEQMFLWLTSPAPVTYGGGGGRILDSPAFYDVSPPDVNPPHHRTFIPHVPGRIRVFNVRAAQPGPHGLPVIFDRTGRLLEVEPPKKAASGRQLILDKAGKLVEIGNARIENGRPVFLDPAGKPIASPRPVLRPELMKLFAAPKGKAVTALKNQPTVVQKFVIGKIPIFIDPFGAVIDTEGGQADGGVLEAQNGSLVYYVTIVNDVYAYFLTGTKDGGITPAPTKFPTTSADLSKITTFASAHGKTFPDPNALAIEVKSSWVEATGLANLSSYITMKATVPTYDKSNPNKWVPNGQKTVQLALVGIHVVGSTAGHPEMIWATFEHFGNTPNATYKYNSTTGVKTVNQSTAGTWLFATNGAASPFNVMHMQFNDPNIEAISPHTISPSNTLRMKVWGAASDASPNPLDPTSAASNTEIISINNSVRGKMPAADIRNNYFMMGSTWTIGGAAPTGSFPSGNEVGTSKLANTTMETYQQGSDTKVNTGVNCFSCHVNNTTGVSHVFNALQPLF